ncbi:unnamed protein product [Rotaria sordida]|uniref:Uncharacterized protein n=1 Tax=Rotaria sordida TaxID=392033 RepID=A0A814DMI5_9BILA|nr:unnamed protein product [Rotaria sordida]CAF0875214.1 unnamed protein product [Rotaria sordida]CAF0957623.1 unnamed protein product [Rotaria sordida]CAF0958380.1 unnamed protein product [Rotaria sordida]CAF3561877.1 unnamed protein product [Rotaria sordida]
MSILHLNKVESRIILQDYKSIPGSQLHHLHFNDDQSDEKHHKEIDQNKNTHIKRKSDFLLSLYGLPYTLVNN